MTKQKIIGLIGQIASGKSQVAEYIKQDFQAEVFKYSNPLRDILRRCYLPETRENLIELSIKLREIFGNDLLNKIIINDLKQAKSELIIIDGIRRRDDIKGIINKDNFYLIYIDTNKKIRFNRLKERLENQDEREKTLKEFKKDLKKETEIYVEKLKKDAHFLIDNNKTLDELYLQVKKTMSKILKSVG